ncbi:MAG: HTTM domain-containing protein [Microthrixaceae bacterium]
MAVFRILFGSLVALGAARFLARGWVDALYLEPEHHLTYPGFSWVGPLPAPYMHLVVVGLAAAGLCIALGWHTRLAAGLFTVGFAYTELIDAALYLNHYWYLTLTGALLCALPVGHHWSVGARAGRVSSSQTVPVGVVWTLRAQLAVVYLFAGIAKLQGDWLLRAEPMTTWLADRADVPVVGGLLGVPATAFVLGWAGALFDCTIVFWLSWRRSRPLAYVAVVVFHGATAMLFQIGLFPWVMILATPVFFEPDWPRRLAGRLTRLTPLPSPSPLVAEGGQRLGRPLLGALAALAVLQLAIPLRHLAIPGDVRWNEAGYYGSWRVMLTEKGGSLRFEVTDPAGGDSWEVDPHLVLTDWQTAQAAVRPDLMLATAHLVADHYRQADGARVEVRADAWMSMNGSAAVRVVDPTLDLADVSRTGGPWWVLDPPGGAQRHQSG